MAFGVGARVVAESESTSRRPRAGVVEEVLRCDPSPRHRIPWDDGHASIYTPASGASERSPPETPTTIDVAKTLSPSRGSPR